MTRRRSANAEYYFRATGYNTSLKKSLVFEGNYIAPLEVAQKKVAEGENRIRRTRRRSVRLESRASQKFTANPPSKSMPSPCRSDFCGFHHAFRCFFL